jgi:hypothetical protein
MEACQFHKCTFGPSRHDDTTNFGFLEGNQNRFTHCTFDRANMSFFEGWILFEHCTFENPNEDPNRGYFLGGDSLTVRATKFKNYSIIAKTKLHTMTCEFFPSPERDIASLMSKASAANEEDPIAEFIFENTKFRNATEILWNTWIKSLTLRRVEVEGEFSTWMGKIRETLVMEEIRKGYYFVARAGMRKKIVIRNCRFSEANSEIGTVFDCSAGNAADVLLENVECTDAGRCDLTGADDGAKVVPEDFRFEHTRNQRFILRGCKIAHLQINYLQTFDLLIEGCQIGKLEMRDGRLGNVTIKNTKFETLDLSRTLATKYDIAPSPGGKLITVESDYPKGGYKII